MNNSESEDSRKRIVREIEKFYKKTMRRPDIPEPAREVMQAIAQSHAGQASLYRVQGRLREAIEEYHKDTELKVTSHAEATVVEVAFCNIGDTYVQLGEVENAITAYESALELWRQYGYGRVPYRSLAQAYLDQGRVKDAISVSREGLERSEDEDLKKILSKAEAQSHTDAE
jgi:tetratricopeptide (TPR) repeat protein